MSSDSFPSTPVVPLPESLRRRPSLQIDLSPSDWNPDIEVYTISPNKTNGIQTLPSMAEDPTFVQAQPLVTLPSASQNHKSDTSPCFVHSHLDKGTLLADWLRNKHHVVDNSDVGVAKSLQLLTPNRTAQMSTFGSGYESNDEDEFSGSLTKQLADTAVGVREMSKQLGAFLSHFHMIL